MSNAEFYKTQLEELVHVLSTPLATMNLASRTLKEFSNDLKSICNSEEFSISLELIQSSIRKINQYISDVDVKILKSNKDN